MVDISSGDKKINITVSTSGNKASVNATPDMAMYYSNKSREWAISDTIVDNEDYSSKYYANVSKQNADKSTATFENLTTNYNEYKTDLENTKNISVEEIETAKTNAISDITNQENLSVDNVNTAGATQVNLATEQATIATEQAEIATAKASEVVESGDNAITAITAQETTSKNNIETKGAEQIELIQNEGATQIANVQSTGFYMRDDKLYYINSQGEETEFKSGGGGFEIGDIGMALYVDESKGLRRYLNGQIVDINANTQAFLDRLKQITTLHPSLLCTEDEWQTAKTMSAFGQVGKFVFNYSGDEVVSVRIPRVVNIQGLFDLQDLGLTVEAGLPNIQGSTAWGANGITTTSFGNQKAFTNSTGALFVSNTNSNYGGIGATGVDAAGATKVSIDASRSNSIYGNSDTVQPEAIQYPYFIQIATGSETENNIINDIELNNPFSLFDSKYSDHELNNLSWLKSEGQWNSKAVYPTAYDKLLKIYNGTETVEGLSVKLSTEDYTDYDFVLNTADETFRLPIKTNLASGKAVVGNGTALGITDGTTSGVLCQDNFSFRHNAFYNAAGVQTGGSAGSIATEAVGKAYGVVTDPTKSGIETSDSDLYLYFYVGETVQNANLIDAGRIGEQLANKINRTGNETVVERYVNGTSWYRAWSDGWIEQGGILNQNNSNWMSVTFLKPYTQTPHIFGSSEFSGSWFSLQQNTVSTTGFTCGNHGTTSFANGKIFWQAKGY